MSANSLHGIGDVRPSAQHPNTSIISVSNTIIGLHDKEEHSNLSKDAIRLINISFTSIHRRLSEKYFYPTSKTTTLIMQAVTQLPITGSLNLSTLIAMSDIEETNIKKEAEYLIRGLAGDRYWVEDNAGWLAKFPTEKIASFSEETQQKLIAMINTAGDLAPKNTSPDSIVQPKTRIDQPIVPATLGSLVVAQVNKQYGTVLMVQLPNRIDRFQFERTPSYLKALVQVRAYITSKADTELKVLLAAIDKEIILSETEALSTLKSTVSISELQKISAILTKVKNSQQLNTLEKNIIFSQYKTENQATLISHLNLSELAYLQEFLSITQLTGVIIPAQKLLEAVLVNPHPQSRELLLTMLTRKGDAEIASLKLRSGLSKINQYALNQYLEIMERLGDGRVAK